MRTSISIILCLMLAFAGTLFATEQPDSLAFSKGVRDMIRRYEGTAPVVLPKMEERKKIERPLSAVPGRMHVGRNIIVDKQACKLHMVNTLRDTLLTFPVCSSRNLGQKHSEDDCKTPEGTFPLYGVYNSTDWTYKNTNSKCYGPWFLSLRTPRYWGVGIHGTNAPGSVPGRRSHGCIRMHNEDITVVKRLTQKDTRVTVKPDRVREEK